MTTSATSTTQAKLPETTGIGQTNPETVSGLDSAMHWHDKLRDGTRVLIRPIGKDDGALERAFIERLSPESREYRFLGQVAVNDNLVRELTDLDYQRDMAFIALRHDAGEKREIGVSRFCVSKDGESCECAVAVSDEWQDKGLGTLLMRHLIEVARQRGIKRMISIDMAENVGMRNLAKSLGFDRKIYVDYPSEVIHTLDLQSQSASRALA
jgi:GNAT superfamily N-acetyltransferase